jgi:hypothetical protein
MTAHLAESLANDPFWEEVVVHVNLGLKQYRYEDYYVLIRLADKEDQVKLERVGENAIHLELDLPERSVDCVVGSRNILGNTSAKEFATINIVDSLDVLIGNGAS